MVRADDLSGAHRQQGYISDVRRSERAQQGREQRVGITFAEVASRQRPVEILLEPRRWAPDQPGAT